MRSSFGVSLILCQGPDGPNDPTMGYLGFYIYVYIYIYVVPIMVLGARRDGAA